MTFRHRATLAAIAAVAVATLSLAARPAPQETAKPQFPVDPQTGRAVGAREITPDALKALVDQHAPVMIIDVRDEAQFTQETIKGAVYIPFADLEARLKEIPKDTTLVFT
jgi:hypothetical protein